MKQNKLQQQIKISRLLFPQGKIEWIVFMISLSYFIFILFFYLLNRNDSIPPEMLGYDTSVHMLLEHKLINMEHLFSWDIRHPLMNIMFLPPIIVDSILSFWGVSWKWEIFSFYSCLLSSYSGLILFKILSTINSKANAFLFMFLFYSFAHTILLSIQIDSFVLSLLFLLILVLSFTTRYSNIFFNNFLFLAIAGATSTNFLKYLFSIFLSYKKIVISIQQLILSSILFILFFLLTIPDLINRFFIQHLGLKYSLLTQTLDYQGTSQKKLPLIIDNFISEPFLFHNQNNLIYSKETSLLDPYPSLFYYIPIIILICFVLISILSNLKDDLVKLFLGFFSIDIIIHIILGYGISEGQIFCAHWFFFVPIVLAIPRKNSSNKYIPLLYNCAILSISLFFIYHNFYCYFNGFHLCT